MFVSSVYAISKNVAKKHPKQISEQVVGNVF